MTEEFSPGVRIVLDRIRDFPQEFSPENREDFFNTRKTWKTVADHIMREKDTFSEEERRAVRTALRNTRRAEFDATVLELLAQPQKKTVIVKKTGGLVTADMVKEQIAETLAKQFKHEHDYYQKAMPKMEGGPV